MPNETMTLDQFFERVSGGKIFTVKFVKRTNNQLRTMNCRRGVRKGVKGVGMSYNPAEKNLLTVYDMQKLEEGATEKGAFRMINLDTLISLKLDGKEYLWDHGEQVFYLK